MTKIYFFDKLKAECCDDKIHCCPQGSKCETKSGTCVQGGDKTEWFTMQLSTVLEIVKCDSRHECPSGNTCCKLKSGQWGCCPLAKVCTLVCC